MLTKMSFNAMIITIICLLEVVLVLSQTYERTGDDRLCLENKDYVDAVIHFPTVFYVIIGKKYFVYNYDHFAYESEGIHETALIDYDQTWKAAEEGQYSGEVSVQKGRFLGGFYTNDVRCDPEPEDVDGDGLFDEPPFDASTPKEDDIHECYWFKHRFTYYQVVLFVDEVNQKDLYHVKFLDGDTEVLMSRFGDKALFYKQGRAIGSRTDINILLSLDALPKSSRFLPVVYDWDVSTLYVIINKVTATSKPRLYYNNFWFRKFDLTWKSIELKDGFTYTGFLLKGFDYYVIAEPYREQSDDTRGPSVLFKMNFNSSTGHPFPLKLLENESGLDLFGCHFITASSLVIYITFGVIIAILSAVLIVILCFVSVNYLFVNKRIIVVKRSQAVRENEPELQVPVIATGGQEPELQVPATGGQEPELQVPVIAAGGQDMSKTTVKTDQQSVVRSNNALKI